MFNNKQDEILRKISDIEHQLRIITYFFSSKVSVKKRGKKNYHKDPLFEEAIRIARAYDKLSASVLQRRLLIGYDRAFKLLAQLEADGFVGSAAGSQPRVVIKTKK